MLNHTLTGLFATRREAEAAIDELRSRGVATGDISVLAQETVVHSKETVTTADHVAAGAGTGTVAGAAAGGLIGLLVGVGALVIPGIGGLLIAGPIAAALGLTGAAATTVSGALSGALAGGLLGGLVGLGFSPEDAEIYEQRIKAGDVLVAVNTTGATASEEMVRDVFNKQGAQEIRYLKETATA